MLFTKPLPLTRSTVPTIATSQGWLIPELLPPGELVVLDGPSGVGKSLLASAFAAQVTHALAPTPYRGEGWGEGALSDPPGCPVDPKKENSETVLWITNAQELNDFGSQYLARHNCDEKHLVILPVEHFSPDLHRDVDPCGVVDDELSEIINQHNPRLIIIDGLEKLFPFLAAQPFDALDYLFFTLRCYATSHPCTILLLRTQGQHQAKSAGKLGRAGLDNARFAMTLAWHPHNTCQRILTVVKNHLGPTGTQFHLDINTNGIINWHALNDEEHTRPGYAAIPPACRPKYHGAVSHVHEIKQRILNLVGTQATPVREVRAHLKLLGYTPKAIRKAITLSGITCQKQGKKWVYLYQEMGTLLPVSQSMEVSDANSWSQSAQHALPQQVNMAT